MPWTVKDVDKHKKGLTDAQKRRWVHVANSVLATCQKEGGKDCEGKAIRQANAQFDLAPDGIWTFDDWAQHDEFFGLATKPQDKPGGSNVGKYKKGPFCGPSGGAPKGSYPVDTKKRAIAAIAYSRHAPNPAGIKKCVCRHWPSLPVCKSSKKKQSFEERTMGTGFDGRSTEVAPAAAFQMTDHNCFAKAMPGEGDKRKLDMIAYSGKIIKNHWWWGDLAIDLSGLKFPKSKYPILESHDVARKIAFTGKPSVKDGTLKINEDSTEFVDTKFAEEFIRLSQQGFPYESSIYALPTNVERLEKGATAQVNGFNMTGPGTIWRQAIFKEASVCVFGHDSNTRSAAFAETEVELDMEVTTIYSTESDGTQGEEVKTKMTLDEFKEQNPDAFAELTEQVREEVTEELTGKFEQEKTDLEQQFAQKETDLKTEMADKNKRLLELEKKDQIRTENELRSQAKGIWIKKLNDSEVPDRLYEKVMQHVSYSSFVENGVLNTEKFTEAVEAEIKDWEAKGVTEEILGATITLKDETGGGDDENKIKDEKADKLAGRLLRAVGQGDKA